MDEHRLVGEERRHGDARGVPGSADVVIEADDFREWARGGAVVAVQSFVTGSD
ncbi:hypothetical protein [Nonomuraea longispora]|uniref:hypothetical protein n=1 Tax=Nonomuraea longispora TaxID=1848320 RepID=UPI0014055A1E|nr:hypothetical protein [Nonomuraea longispora]